MRKKSKLRLLTNRKSQRQLSFNKSTHLILRLREGLPNFFDPRDRELRNHIANIAEKYDIRVYELVLNHSHLHSVVLLPDRTSYVRFIRELTAFITRYIEKSLAIPFLKLKKIFSNRPFTRSVPWGKAYQILMTYMRQNEKESGVAQPRPAVKSKCRQLVLWGDGPPI